MVFKAGMIDGLVGVGIRDFLLDGKVGDWREVAIKELLPSASRGY